MTKNLYKFLALLFVGLLFLPLVYGQSAIITGNAGTVAGDGTAPVSLQVQLVGCTGNTPLANGTTLINPLQWTFAASGSTVTGTLWGNNVILCGTQYYSLYAVTWLANGLPVSPTAQYRLTQGQTCNISNGTCNAVGFIPPVIAKGSGNYCPANQVFSGFNVDYTVKCVPIPTGSVGPPGCVLGQTCTNPYNVINTNGVLNADSFSGADICAKINAAQASVAGTSVNPTPSVVIKTSPGNVYSFNNQCIIANDNSYPFIHKVILDFQGSSLTWNGAAGTPPIILRGENSSSPLDTGWITGISFFTTNTSVPALISNSGRPGFGIIDVKFNGNSGLATACYSMINTTVTGGIGYNEGSLVKDSNFDNCPDGIAMHRSTGATDSMDYSWFVQNHFQLQGTNSGLHIYGDEGSGPLDIQHASFSSNTNTAGGIGPAATIRIDSGSTLLSTTLDIGGEDTGGNGFYDIIGFFSGDGHVNSRASLGLASSNPISYSNNNNSAISNTSQLFAGKNGTSLGQGNLHENEGAPLGRSYLLGKIVEQGGQSYKVYGPYEGTAPEQQGNSNFKLMNCGNGTGNPDVFDPAVRCIPGFNWEPSGFGGPGGLTTNGTGWGEEGSAAQTSLLPSQSDLPLIGSEVDWVGHSFVAISQIGDSTTQLNAPQIFAIGCGVGSQFACSEGYFGNHPIQLTNWIPSGALVQGFAFTGTCAPTTTLTVINGRIAGCS